MLNTYSNATFTAMSDASLLKNLYLMMNRIRYGTDNYIETQCIAQQAVAGLTSWGLRGHSIGSMLLKTGQERTHFISLMGRTPVERASIKTWAAQGWIGWGIARIALAPDCILSKLGGPLKTRGAGLFNADLAKAIELGVLGDGPSLRVIKLMMLCAPHAELKLPLVIDAVGESLAYRGMLSAAKRSTVVDRTAKIIQALGSGHGPETLKLAQLAKNIAVGPAPHDKLSSSSAWFAAAEAAIQLDDYAVASAVIAQAKQQGFDLDTARVERRDKLGCFDPSLERAHWRFESLVQAAIKAGALRCAKALAIQTRHTQWTHPMALGAMADAAIAAKNKPEFAEVFSLLAVSSAHTLLQSALAPEAAKAWAAELAGDMSAQALARAGLHDKKTPPRLQTRPSRARHMAFLERAAMLAQAALGDYVKPALHEAPERGRSNRL